MCVCLILTSTGFFHSLTCIKPSLPFHVIRKRWSNR